MKNKLIRLISKILDWCFEDRWKDYIELEYSCQVIFKTSDNIVRLGTYIASEDRVYDNKGNIWDYTITKYFEYDWK